MSATDQLRAFICIELPLSLRHALGNVQADLRNRLADVSWPACENIHGTLAFLGNVAPETIPTIAATIGEAAQRAQPFQLRLEGFGGFPSLARPRVLWVGLGGETESLRGLQSDLMSGLKSMGLDLEERRYSPHLTIGRIKNPRHPPRVKNLEPSVVIPAEAFGVHEVVLMRSQLSPQGSRYTALARVGLGQRIRNETASLSRTAHERPRTMDRGPRTED